MQERLALYRAQALHYWENALVSLQQGDTEKAGEFLWGCMAEALKGVAALKGRVLRSHWELRAFARALASELSLRLVQNAFVRADRLHSNFYESFLTPEDLAEDVEEIREAVRVLLELMEEPTRV